MTFTALLLNKWPTLFSSLVLLASLVSYTLAQQSTQETGETTSVSASYRIRSGDKLAIKFLYHSELNEPSVIVRPDGFITLSMIDEVMAKGLTIAELKTRIEKAYSEALLAPVVSINLIDYVTPRVYVAGQVTKPGRIELRDGETLIQAIALAGGFTREANRKLVLHGRPASGGKLKLTTINLLQTLTDSTVAQEVLLQDGDYIFVPDSKLSRMSRVFEAFRAAVPGIGIGINY